MTVIDYTLLEEAVAKEVLNEFGEFISEQAIGNNFDDVWDYMISNDETFGCYIEYGGGRRDRNAPFAQKANEQGRIWRASVLMVFIVRYKGEQQVEDDLRKIANNLANFPKDSRLAGTVALSRLESIERPEIVKVNDVPSYWLGVELFNWTLDQ